MVSENVNEVQYGHAIPRFFSRETVHNLLRFCVHFAKNFVNHALSEIILLRRALGRTTLDVGSRVQEHMRTSPPPTLNKYEELHNLDFITFSKLYHRVIL